jgi:hypothetical protein
MQWQRSFFLIFLSCLLASCGAPPVNEAVGAKAATLPTGMPPTPSSRILSDPVGGTTDSRTPTAFPIRVPDSCAVTQPPQPPFTPPAPHSPEAPYKGDFWYGTNALWTAVPKPGVWATLPHNPAGYTQKVFWWRKGYSWTQEPTPALTVTGRRLDAPAPSLNISRATNAFADDIKSAMLVGVDFPTPGCWEISGRYADQELSFVVWVAP